MKVFEKMEKREERRKEAMARGDQGSKRSSVDSKTQKVMEMVNYFLSFFLKNYIPVNQYGIECQKIHG